MSFENKYVYMKSIKAEMSKSPEDSNLTGTCYS